MKLLEERVSLIQHTESLKQKVMKMKKNNNNKKLQKQNRKKTEKENKIIMMLLGSLAGWLPRKNEDSTADDEEA